MISLDSLTSSGKKRKRIGRSGGRGGTSGKGHKGQKARSGPKIRTQYEGGQMPLTRRFPKHGFNNAPFRTSYELVNIKELDVRFEHGEVVTAQALFEKGLIKGGRRLLKILGDGTLSKKLVVHADKFSKTAADRILNSGGEVHHIEPKKVSMDAEKKKVKARSKAA